MSVPVRGYHGECQRYSLVADERGIVSCSNCGEVDLLPRLEAIEEAHGSVERLDKWARRFAKEVRRGRRSPRLEPWK